MNIINALHACYIETYSEINSQQLVAQQHSHQNDNIIGSGFLI